MKGRTKTNKIHEKYHRFMFILSNKNEIYDIICDTYQNGKLYILVGTVINLEWNEKLASSHTPRSPSYLKMLHIVMTEYALNTQNNLFDKGHTITGKQLSDQNFLQNCTSVLLSLTIT